MSKQNLFKELLCFNCSVVKLFHKIFSYQLRNDRSFSLVDEILNISLAV